jgi:hypothetical protein
VPLVERGSAAGVQRAFHRQALRVQDIVLFQFHVKIPNLVEWDSGHCNAVHKRHGEDQDAVDEHRVVR